MGAKYIVVCLIVRYHKRNPCVYECANPKQMNAIGNSHKADEATHKNPRIQQ